MSASLGTSLGERIRLAHGGGGVVMQQLIATELSGLYADPTQLLHDAASLALPHGRLAFSTDSYVVQPLEFPGGDIGRLAVIGTANDLAMVGARPLHLSVGLILEEGLELGVLRRVIASLAAAARECGVTVVTGDTKVVERGKGDGVFINTSGLGLLDDQAPIGPAAIRPGDQLVVSGDLGRHWVAILAARHGLRLEPPLSSDCAPLWPAVQRLLAAGLRPHGLRDLTRGGLAAALQELAAAAAVDLVIEEPLVPVAEPVARTCALLGLEPLQLANEGRFLAVLPPAALAPALALLQPSGATWIGTVEAGPARVRLRTGFGSERLLAPLSGDLLPRIC